MHFYASWSERENGNSFKAVVADYFSNIWMC